MNIIPISVCCEALFAPENMHFRYGEIVYTEDVGGSSPSSPTTKPFENVEFRGLFTKFPLGSLNLFGRFCASFGGS